MKQWNIKMRNMSDMLELVKAANQIDSDVDLKCGRYVVDAKSIMGALSIGNGNLCSVIVIDDADTNNLEKVIQDFIVKE